MDAAESLISFTEYTNPEYQAGRHHLEIAEHLEAVERGDIDRLMVFEPPRHGKSELCSKRFPGWYLGRNPGNQMIGASYNTDLATDFGRDVRNLVNSQDYANVFATQLAPDSQSANRWHTNRGGVYVAAGIGSGISGRGAHVGLIDDPIKDRAEADSEINRKRIWDWYRSTFYTRLLPGGAIILIETRWHDDDLAGRILNSKQASRWVVLEHPAIDDQGEALWPEWYPVNTLEDIRAAIGEREFSALYQQRPQPDEGTFFKRQWFEFYPAESLPPRLHFYGASDYAVTDEADGTDADYTEHGIFGVDANENIYIADWWHDRTSADVWINEQCRLIRKWKPLMWVGEGGVIRRAIEPFLKSQMRRTKAYCRLEWLPVVNDKPTRARGFQSRAAMRKVFLPDDERGHRLLEQLLRFPVGKHDDSIDVCSLFGRILDEVVGGSFGDFDDVPEPAARADYEFGSGDHGGESWKTI